MELDNIKTRDELTRWMFKPYNGVYPSQGSLRNVPSALDHASKKNCRAQSYSSWLSSSLSYVTSMARGSQTSTNASPTQGCSNWTDDGYVRETPNLATIDVKKTREASNIPVYGLKPSPDFLKIIPSQQKMMIQARRLHYIDHLVLSCKEWDRYRTMTYCEKILYHCNKLVEFAHVKYQIPYDDIQKLLYGVHNGGKTYYLDDQNMYMMPPATLHEQVQVYRYDLSTLSATSAQMDAIYANALKLSQLMRTLRLRAPSGQTYSSPILSLVMLDGSGTVESTVVKYLNFNSKGNDTASTDSITLLDQRVTDASLKHCDHLSFGLRSKTFNTGIDLDYKNTNITRDKKEKLTSFTNVFKLKSIPVRQSNVSHIPSRYEKLNIVLPTPTFNSLAAKLLERNQTGSLGALVKRAVVRDPGGALALIQTMIGQPTSAMDVAPLVRMLNMISSLDVDACFIDLTPYQLIRDYARVDASVHIVGKTFKKSSKAFCMFLDDFINYVSGSVVSTQVTDFSPQMIDRSWIGIPVTDEILRSTAIWPYTVSFLDSRITNGTINWLHRGLLSSAAIESSAYTQGVAYVTIPASNTHVLTGMLNFVYILIDHHDRSANDDVIRICDNDFHIYNPSSLDQVAQTNFHDIWNNYYVTNRLWAVLNDYNFAYNYFMKNNLTVGLQSMALAAAAESRFCAKMGTYIQPDVVVGGASPHDMDYQFQQAMGGSWHISSDGVMTGKQTSKNSHVTTMAGTLDALITYCHDMGSDLTNMISGYNFASLSSACLLPNGRWSIENSDQVIVDQEVCQFMSFDNGDGNATVMGYNLSQATTLNRLAVSLGLLERDLTPILLLNAGSISAWIYMHATSIITSCSLFLSLNNINLHYWSGLDAYVMDSFAYNLLSNIKESTFIGFINHACVVPELCARTADHTWYTDMELFYTLLVDNLDFMSSTPVGVVLMLQWYKKTIEREFIADSNSVWFLFNNRESVGYQVGSKSGINKILSTSTLDINRYAPKTFMVGDNKSMVGMWVENYSRITTVASGSQGYTHPDAYNTKPTTRGPYDVLDKIIDPARMYVINSTSETTNSELLSFAVSELNWPDPPGLNGPGDFVEPKVTVPPNDPAPLPQDLDGARALIENTRAQLTDSDEGLLKPNMGTVTSSPMV